MACDEDRWSSRQPKWVWAAVVPVGVLLALYGLQRLVCDYWMGGYENDFKVYYDVAQRWLSNAPLYVAETGFIYPPPSVLVFAGLTSFSCHTAYVVFSGLSFVFLALAVLGYRGILMRAGIRVSRRGWWLIGSLSLALAPTFENAAWGQVNTLVLLDAVMFFWLLQREKDYSAGAVLAWGAWFKVYPAILLWYVFLDPRRWRAVVGFVATGALLPLLLCGWVPLREYGVFFANIVTQISETAKPTVLNQSLVGALSRVRLGPVDMTLNTRMALDPWINWLNKMLLAGVLGWLAWWCRQREPARLLLASAILMAAIPVFSPLGWCYVYVLTYPLILLVMLSKKPTFLRAIAVGGVLALMMPAYHILPGAERFPVWIQNALYSRYLLAIVAISLIGCCGGGERRRFFAFP